MFEVGTFGGFPLWGGCLFLFGLIDDWLFVYGWCLGCFVWVHK